MEERPISITFFVTEENSKIESKRLANIQSCIHKVRNLFQPSYPRTNICWGSNGILLIFRFKYLCM